MWILLVLLLLHGIVNLLVLLGIKSRKLKVHSYMFFVSLLLPFWGAFIVLILHFQIWFEADDCIQVGTEKFTVESELYKSISVDDKKVADSTVPIEEALVINSAEERRAIIMDILNDNPKEYIEFLQKAGNNDDTEVVHYAVTAMVEISKENDYRLQTFEREYTANPEDQQLLRAYSDYLWNCLDRNMMQGQVEVLNRELFSTLIQKILSLGGSVSDYRRAVENDIKRKQYTMAAETLRRMKELYADGEDYYLLQLEYLASLGRGEEIRQLLAEIDRRHIFLSSKAKEVLAFWKK